MTRLTTSLLLLLTRAAALGLAAGALRFYRAGSSTHGLQLGPEWSSTILCLQFIMCLAEFVVQLVCLCQGFGPLPHDFQLRFWVMAADAVLPVLTWASTSAVLSVSSVLINEGAIDHAIYLRLLWHGRLGVVCGTVSVLTAVLNDVVTVNEPEPQQPGAP